MAKKALRIGFDLDGVILYNPVRIFRPLASFFKPLVFKPNGQKFYFPRTGPEKFLWRILHKTSFWEASGLKDIGHLASTRKIEPYIITARYDFLKNDVEQWFKKIQVHTHFSKCIYNTKNEEPHFFKERMIRDLNLDVFVEDNWGIVEYLSTKFSRTKIVWIYNLLDSTIPYPYKFPSLKKTIEHITSYDL